MHEQSLFIEALEKADPFERAAFLDRACGADSALRERLERLLAHHAVAASGPELPLVVPPPVTAERAAAEHPGCVVGSYKLLQQIGEGGMGTVYMAEQLRPVQRKVAFKVIKPGMDSRQVIARFEAERQALAVMDHVNIARVFDGGTTESGRPYFVMELVHGVPITKYCDDNHLTPRERLELFVSVCQAIQHAHQKGIIHRDIKPSNVMVTLYDGRPVPKVIDFGVAKATEQKLTERTLFTQYGAMVGTLEYMSPEQAEMSGLGVDTRSDIYSLGVLLYELLTGSTPITRQRLKEAALGEILRLIREEEPPKPSTRLSDSGEALASISAQRKTEPAKLSNLMRGELDWIVLKTLEKDRNRRYETANGLAQDVRRYLQNEAVQACPPSAAYRLRKVLGRNKTVLATAAAFVLVLLLGTALSMWQAVRATNSEMTARAERDSADAARENERIERENAEAATGKAQLADAENRRTLARQYVANGARLLEQGNRTDALLWFVEALRKDAADDDRVAMHRRRIAAVAQLCPRPEQLWFHSGPVSRAVFTPDGRRVLTVSGTEVRLWDVLSGQPIFAALQHAAPVRNVAFSGDGLRLLTFSGEQGAQPGLLAGEVRVWDMATGQPLTPVLPHEWSQMLPLFSPDGRRVLTLSGIRQETRKSSPTGAPLIHTLGGDARLWDSGTGKPLSAPLTVEEGVLEAHFSPDGRRLYTASQFGQARLWETETGRPVSDVLTSDPAGRIIRAHSFTPDGKQLFLTFSGGAGQEHLETRGWDATTGESLGPAQKLSYSQYSAGVCAVVMHGRHVLVAPSRVDAQIFDALTGQPVGQPLKLDPGITYSKVSFTADGKRVLGAYWPANRVGDMSRGEARLWDAVTGRAQTPPMMLDSTVEAHAFSTNGDRVVLVEGHKTVRVWDAATGRPRTPPIRHEGQALQAVLSPDGRRLLTTAGHEARVWDATSGRPLTPLLKHNGLVVSASFSPEGAHILTASQDGTARLWPVTAGEPPTHRLDHDGPLAHAVFSPDGRTVYTDTEAAPEVRADYGKAWLWDAASGQVLSPPINIMHSRGNQPPIAPFSPDSRFLASVQGKNVQLLDVRTGRPARAHWKHERVYRLAFTPDSRALLVLQLASDRDESGQHEATLWDVGTGEARTPSLKTSGKMLKQGLLRPTFSPDGSRLALAPENAGPNRYGQLWDTRTGLPVAPPFELAQGVFLAFSADSERLELTSPDFPTQVLDTRTGRALGAPPADEQALRLKRLGIFLGGFSSDRLRGCMIRGPEVQVVDVATGQQLAPLRHPAAVNAAGITPEGRAVLTVNGATVVEAHGIWYAGVRGSWMYGATYRARGELRLWDAHTDEPLTPPLAYLARDAFPSARLPEISRDGRRLLLSEDPNTVEIWELPDVGASSNDELVQLAQALSGRRFDVTGGSVLLETEVWAAARARIAEARPARPFDLASWQRREAARSVEDKDWSAAIPHLDRLIAARPEWWAHYARGRCRFELADYQASVADNTRAIELRGDDFRCWHNRGTALWRLGHVNEAAADFEKAITFPDYGQLYGWCAVVRARAHLGDAAGYRRACESLVARWRDQMDPNTCAWLLVLAPDALADLGAIVALAEKGYKQSPTLWTRNTLGAAQYRAGQWEQALQTLEQNKGDGAAFDWLFLAMAHHRLGNSEKARESLAW